MKISYDKEIDALYIRLLEGEQQCKTIRLTDEIALNFGKKEKLIGIEIIDVSDVLGHGEVPKVILENIESSNL